MKTATAGNSGASSLGRLRWEARDRAGPSWRPLHDVSALVVGGTSGLTGTCSLLMQVGPHLFVVGVVLLDPLTLGAAEAPFLTPCRIAKC
jgi:hypothetical protein